MQEIKKQDSDIQQISFSNILWMFFDAILRFLKHLILFFYKYRLMLLIFFFFGCIAGLLLGKLVKPTFLQSMMIKHTELNSRTFGEMINELDKLAKAGSNVDLSQMLGLPATTCSNIAGISAKNMQGEDLSKDTSQLNTNTFLVSLVVRDNKIADKLQYAIINYFNTNPYLRKLKTDKIQLRTGRLAFLSTELNKLDTLKDEYNKFLSSTHGATFYNNAFNPVDLYKQSSAYQEEKNSIEEWLKQSKESIVNINGTKATAIPQSMGLLNYVFIYGILFLAFGCLIAAISAVIKS